MGELSHGFPFLKSRIFSHGGLDRFLLICPSCREGNTPAPLALEVDIGIAVINFH